MKIRLPVKHLGVSWIKWFLILLEENEFTKVNSQKYVKGDIEIRIFRPQKYYQVVINGEKVSSDLDFSFPHLTNRLYA